jgi:hypothetical protein
MSALEEVRKFEKTMTELFKNRLTKLLAEEKDFGNYHLYMSFDEETKDVLNKLLYDYDMELYGLEITQYEFNITYSFGVSYRDSNHKHFPRHMKFSIADDESWYDVRFKLCDERFDSEIHGSLTDEFFNTHLVQSSSVLSIIKHMNHNFTLLSLKSQFN